MFIIRFLVSKVYTFVLKFNLKDERQAVFYTTITYLCHINVGFYCSLLSLLTMLLSISTNEFTLKHTQQAAKRVLKLHGFVLLYLSWWIIPLCISYAYTYNAMASSSSSTLTLTTLVDMYTNGEFLFLFHVHDCSGSQTMFLN